MDSFNPTTKTQAALTAALQAASAAGNPEIRPAHLLLALLTQTDGIAGPLLEAVGVNPATIRAEAQRLVERLPSSSGATSQPQLSRESLAAINTAQQLATEMNDEFVSTEHLLVGLATGDSEVAKLLTNAGASPQALREAFVKVRGSARVTSADPEGSYQALEKYSTDLTALQRALFSLRESPHSASAPSRSARSSRFPTTRRRRRNAPSRASRSTSRPRSTRLLRGSTPSRPLLPTSRR